MKNAFVYYLEFTDDSNIYITLLTESIRRLINYQYCRGCDIFVNVVGYSGQPVWSDNKYKSVSDNENTIWNQLKNLADKYNINIIDVSEDRLHYVELPILINLSFPAANDTPTFTSTDTTRLKLFNHKFTSYTEIIQRGYDRIIQIDADLFFYKRDNNLFNIPLSTDPNKLYFCRFNDTVFKQGLTIEAKKDNIKNRIKEREHNMVKLFALHNSTETKHQYQLAKNFIKGSLNYNLDSFVDDIYNQNFWVHGGLGIFDKPFIDKHFNNLSFINYFVTKDDEIALMLYCFANKISLLHLDSNNTICCSGPDRNTFDHTIHTAYHPQGDSNIKTDFINNNWIPI
jgi:hypothetical protein